MSASTITFSIPSLSLRVRVTDWKRSLTSILLLPILLLTLCSAPACSVAQFVATFDKYAAEIGPAVQAIFSILALFGVGQPMAVEPTVDADLQKIESLMNDFAVADAASQPGIRAQLVNAMSVLMNDLDVIFSVARVENPASQAKVTALVNLTVSLVEEMIALIPDGTSDIQLNAAFSHAKLAIQSKGDFVNRFNLALTTLTGVMAVDELTPRLKLHNHSKFIRIVTLGKAH